MATNPARMSVREGERRMTEAHNRDPVEQESPGSPATSLEYRCRQITASLRETLGPDGSAALIGRALAACEPQHPVVKLLRGGDGREIGLDGVSTAVGQHGLQETEAAVDAMIASLAGILGRLIGDDMAMRLLDLDAGEPGQNQETP